MAESEASAEGRLPPDSAIASLLRHARLLTSKGGDAQAIAVYLDVLRRDPAHLAALNELGGLARVLTAEGAAGTAAPHWQHGFSQRPIVTRPYRGTGTGVPVLLLVSANGGNIPTRRFLYERDCEISALYAEFDNPLQELPPHALVFNAIGDAELSSTALARAEAAHGAGTGPGVRRR